MDNLRLIRRLLGDRLELIDSIASSKSISESLNDSVNKIIISYQEGGKVLICGNGGSAADAQHIAAELSGRFYLDRKPLDAQALHVNSSYLTAVANDISFDDVFSRQVEARGKKGDVLLAISTSGRSVNILNAARVARGKGMTVIALTGSEGAELVQLSDISIVIPSDDTPAIQEGHILAGHIICQLVEFNLFSDGD